MIGNHEDCLVNAHFSPVVTTTRVNEVSSPGESPHPAIPHGKSPLAPFTRSTFLMPLGIRMKGGTRDDELDRERRKPYPLKR
jgi:hypothetical protein